jgi:hypothetical protein
VAFSDPQSVTINAVANSLPRVEVSGESSSYKKDDETLQLTISHTEKNRVRRMVRLDFNKIATDPFNASQSNMITGSCYLVIDEPAGARFSNTELLNYVKGLVGWATDANLTKVIAGES